ncbi:MAG: tripartite tricarboxylate transporter permease [Rhodobacteraceae bacterium]|nr:tripartite tricarboxylate transporter permease [Paracoccaceae bacterium]
MLPGLGPLMGIVALPVAFPLEPIPAMAMLIAVHVGGSAGGSISAILLHIPGTPLAAATLFDRYPLAQKGHSQDAIGRAITASSPGGLVAGIMLIFFSPVLADLALNFAPPEYARHGAARPADHRRGLRGLGHQGHARGRLGLVVATVDIDEFTQTDRYTFGTINLTSGANLVTVLGGTSPSRSFSCRSRAAPSATGRRSRSCGSRSAPSA